MYLLFPNIEKEIQRKIRELNLKKIENPPSKLIAQKKRFYRTVCYFKKERVFFKTLLKKEKGIKKRFLNEIEFYANVENNFPSLPIKEHLPKLIKYSLNSKFPYLLYKFERGETKTSETKLKKEELKKIVEILQKIQKIPTEVLGKKSEKKDNKKILGTIKELEKLKRVYQFPPEVEKRALEILKWANSWKNLVVSHGDFSETNLVFQKSNIKIIDWEHVGVRNPFYDFADFFVKRWRFEDEQKFLLSCNKAVGKPKNLKLFSFSILLVIIKNLKILAQILKEKDAPQVRFEAQKYIQLLKKYL
jgi:thiamine kinase-like enzyme